MQREQFELSVDGKPQPISFFEQVKAGSSKERAQLASITADPAEKATAINDTRGRTIVFFIDDLHLALDSLGRTRKMLSQFIDKEMNENDRVAIASTSSMSSLFLRERPVVAATPDNLPNGSQPMLVDVDHRFARSSIIRFQTYVYNASRVAGAPDVWIAASVFCGSQQVMIVAPSKIPPDVSPDSWRLPYWSEIVLNQLPPGAYTLQVSANDKGARTITSQIINFSVE